MPPVVNFINHLVISQVNQPPAWACLFESLYIEVIYSDIDVSSQDNTKMHSFSIFYEDLSK